MQDDEVVAELVGDESTDAVESAGSVAAAELPLDGPHWQLCSGTERPDISPGKMGLHFRRRRGGHPLFSFQRDDGTDRPASLIEVASFVPELRDLGEAALDLAVFDLPAVKKYREAKALLDEQSSDLAECNRLIAKANSDLLKPNAIDLLRENTSNAQFLEPVVTQCLTIAQNTYDLAKAEIETAVKAKSQAARKSLSDRRAELLKQLEELVSPILDELAINAVALRRVESPIVPSLGARPEPVSAEQPDNVQSFVTYRSMELVENHGNGDN